MVSSDNHILNPESTPAKPRRRTTRTKIGRLELLAKRVALTSKREEEKSFILGKYAPETSAAKQAQKAADQAMDELVKFIRDNY